MYSYYAHIYWPNVDYFVIVIHHGWHYFFFALFEKDKRRQQKLVFHTVGSHANPTKGNICAPGLKKKTPKITA